MTPRRGTRGDDRGSATVELAVLAPAFVMFFALVMLVGRVQSTRADLQAAAHAAARTITLARDPNAAIERAEQAARERLDEGSASCSDMGWDPQITSSEATVTITCTVDLSEAALIPAPGTFDASATATEVFDRHVEQTGINP